MPAIFKILDSLIYRRSCTQGQFTGVEIDILDGYIHFSSVAQVIETAQKHFAGRENLMIMAVEADALGADLKWEASRGGQLFPHLYAPLDMRRVAWAKPLIWNGTSHDFPPETFA